MKEYVTWGNVERFVLELADISNKCNRQFDGVYGLPRGGLVIAVMVSHVLDIPLLSAPTSKSLIVDDICDSGESLLHYIKNTSSEYEEAKRPYIATIFWNDNDLGIKPDFSMFKKKDRWIVFPWEKEQLLVDIDETERICHV